MDKPNKNELLYRAVRALEVLKILGGEIPKNYDVSSEIINIIVDRVKSNNNYMRISNDFTEILLENNGHRYHWNRFFNENRDTVIENFNVDYRNLSVEFFECEYATVTSGFFLYNDVWCSPKINSSIDSVSIWDGEVKEELPIESYYDVFSTYMKSKKDVYGCALANDPVVVDIIVKIFEKPIKEQVSDLINNDQSWRFKAEKESILSYYSESVKRASDLFEKKIRTATDQYTMQLNSSAEIREEGLRELEKMQGRYLHKLNKGPLV